MPGRLRLARDGSPYPQTLIQRQWSPGVVGANYVVTNAIVDVGFYRLIQ